MNYEKERSCFWCFFVFPQVYHRHTLTFIHKPLVFLFNFLVRLFQTVQPATTLATTCLKSQKGHGTSEIWERRYWQSHFERRIFAWNVSMSFFQLQQFFHLSGFSDILLITTHTPLYFFIIVLGTRVQLDWDFHFDSAKLSEVWKQEMHHGLFTFFFLFFFFLSFFSWPF